ncbi:hypothetical protein EJ03DRAFT_329147 [Teratosphaeria nubilosa]|uniref:F-box domain-containing protein n=1 Tax=Teratosphaeria nubilosa TaxID=161662 RepID=A0A6G1L5J6_9PEZI|nr:hypothetical protein EJ03DRAFT_329147 [Teratosphaeria nubilosa]
MSSISTLPPELLLNITDFIHRRSDLNNLCRVSRRLQATAIPRLYEYTKLDLDKFSSARPNGFFTAGNPGPEHVKKLSFTPSEPRDPVDAVKVMKKAILLCAKDGLRSLRLPNKIKLDDGLFVIVYMNQQRLQSVELGLPGQVLGIQLRSPTFPDAWLSTIKRLRTPELIESSQDLEAYGSLLARLHNLQELEIQTHSFTTDEADSTPLLESLDKESLALKTLLAGTKKGNEMRAMQLERLVLSRQDLSYPRRTLTSSINFSMIVTLELELCNSATTLLDTLAMDFRDHGAELKVLKAGFDSRDCTALTNFLRSFSGLRAVELYYSTDADGSNFDLSWLATHESTLKQLRVCAWDPSAMAIAGAPLRSYAPLSEGFPKLNSVATAMPTIRLSNGGAAQDDGLQAYFAAFDAIVTNCERKLVCFFGTPSMETGGLVKARSLQPLDVKEAYVELNMRRYAERLDRFVDQLFARIAAIWGSTSREAAPLLIFMDNVIREHGSDSTSPFEVISYVPSTQASALGPIRLAGIRVPIEELALIYPSKYDPTKD